MRSLTVILSLLLILMLAFGAFFYAGGTLRAEVSCITASAADYPDAFAAIREVVSSGSAPAAFAGADLSDPAGYSLVDVNVTLTNRGLFDAEWLNIQPQGAPGDVAVYSLSGDGADVPARGTAQLNFKYVTRADGSTPRAANIQYYVYGISRTIEINF